MNKNRQSKKTIRKPAQEYRRFLDQSGVNLRAKSIQNGFQKRYETRIRSMEEKIAERYRSDPQKVVFYYSKTKIFINPPWCQFGVKIDSKWGPVTALKSKETGLWGSLKFMSILTCFLEPTRTPNGYPQKWSFCDFSVLWIQGCPKAPQRVHLGSQVGVLRFLSVCSKASQKVFVAPQSVF